MDPSADSFVRRYQVPHLAFVLLTIAESVLIAWLFNNTHGSVLLMALFHASSDAALSYAGVLFGSDALFWLTVVVFWAAAGIVVLVGGSLYLSRNAEARWGETTALLKHASGPRASERHSSRLLSPTGQG